MTENILHSLKRRYESGVKLLSNQEHLDLLSVATFLELSGVEFEASQLILVPEREQPPDVIFHFSALARQQHEICMFEVTEYLPIDTRRDREMRIACHAVTDAVENNSTFDEYVHERNISLGSRTHKDFHYLLNLIKERALKKYTKYYMDFEKIDILILIQDNKISLQPDQSIFCPSDIVIQAWRSVSFVMPPAYCGVIYINTNAPEVLKAIHGQGLIFRKDRPDIFDEMIKKLGLKYDLE